MNYGSSINIWCLVIYEGQVRMNTMDWGNLRGNNQTS